MKANDPNAMRLERRNWNLWLLTFVLILALALTVYVLYVRMTLDVRDSETDSSWIQSGYLTGIGLVGLVCIFVLYTVVQQLELKRLRQRLSGEERDLEQMQNRLGEITHLFEIATELNLRFPVDTILMIMVRRVVSALRAQQASVMLFSPESGVLETRAYYGVEGEFTASGRVRIGEGIAGRVAEKKQAMRLDGDTRNPEFTQYYRPHRQITSALSVPIVVEDQCLGVLNVNRISHPNLFNDRQKDILRLFAENIGAVIRRASDLEKMEAANRGLASDNARLREVNRMKDIFLSTASHELKTPLTSVIGYAEILNDHDRDLGSDQRKEFTRRLKGEAEQLLGLIEDILDLTRLETGKIELKRSRITLMDLSRAAVETVRSLAQKHEVTIVEDYERQDEALSLDEVKIRQALVNLCVNAIKFSPAKGEIRVRTRHEEDGAVVEVTDQGPGVTQEESAQIFTLFGQGHRPTTKGSTGLGIGLHLVKRIVELHGGSVGVRSVSGAGSTFWIKLPREATDHQAQAA
jgi:signal transduction histidine kinase/NADH:ubiquinone oxidoreductase subunit 6 (subunit J)